MSPGCVPNETAVAWSDRGGGERLQAHCVAVRCVSMPSWELFDALPQGERDADVLLCEYGFSVEEVCRRALALHAQGERRERRDTRP